MEPILECSCNLGNDVIHDSGLMLIRDNGLAFTTVQRLEPKSANDNCIVIYGEWSGEGEGVRGDDRTGGGGRRGEGKGAERIGNRGEERRAEEGEERMGEERKRDLFSSLL